MRLYARNGPNTGVSVGLFGAFVLGVLLATTAFWLAVIGAAVLLVAGLYAGALWLWRRSRR
jgi:hypothetical protein